MFLVLNDDCGLYRPLLYDGGGSTVGGPLQGGGQYLYLCRDTLHMWNPHVFVDEEKQPTRARKERLFLVYWSESTPQHGAVHTVSMQVPLRPEGDYLGLAVPGQFMILKVYTVGTGKIVTVVESILQVLTQSPGLYSFQQCC
uniref:Uncharacterized protein LOC111108843 n=1 Tax=Crassostrea virginica TaxID=6565 RepID=A0A8B8BB35_CRAVI|nr:uncharacterized protein LOC111108843 [Crassostrea virginica]